MPHHSVPLHFLLVLLLPSLLLLTTSTTTTINHGSSSNHPNFQHLNVQESILSTKSTHHSPSTTNENHDELLDDEGGVISTDGKLKLKLIHRDHLPTTDLPSSLNHTHRFSDRIRRDVKRVAGLVRRLSATTSHTDNYETEAFGSDVISGMQQGSGEYFVRIGVGSPPRTQYVVIDSGSDIVWVQCQPCNQCYKQSDPVFDPSKSASFSGIPCESSICNRLENSDCHSGHCKYEVQYSDGSYTKGTLALETVTIGGTQIRDMAIGCGHRNQGMFVGAAGLLGLGGGSMSFVGQLGGQTGGAFTYCLLSRGTDSTGSLQFGRETMPVGATWIPLIQNPLAPSFYYVKLSGLGVGGTQLPISQDLFQISEAGNGGVVMDTGTAITRLPTQAYEAFRDEFIRQTSTLPRAPSTSIFDTCYNLAGYESVRVPTVAFYFEEGPMLTLPARNFLIPMNEAGTFCFAFAASPTGLSIIGNIQQEGIQVSVDGANGFIGFGPNVC